MMEISNYVIGTVAYLVIVAIGIGCIAVAYAAVEWILERWK